VGGAEQMLLQLVTQLDPARYEITVVSLHRLGSPMDREFAAAGVDVVYLDKRLGLDARMFSRIDAAILRLRPDLVHTHRGLLQYALPSIVGRLGRRVVHTVHSVAEREVENALTRASHWLAFRAGVAPVAICESVADSILRVYGVRAVAVIPNGVPVRTFRSPRLPPAEWRAANRIPAGAVAFACVARLSPQKDIGALLRAFASLDGGEVLLLCGGGEEQAELRAAARALGVAERVFFLGPRSDVPDVLAASDAFVLSSRYEGHPLSVMEAMAAGRPVIATAVGGVPELVRQGETGILVPPGDVEALSQAMRRLAADRGAREALGRNGLRVATETCDTSLMTARYDRLYQDVLARARA
jgi:glycosyltransferase involved in cell wall biosynthesis